MFGISSLIGRWRLKIETREDLTISTLDQKHLIISSQQETVKIANVTASLLSVLDAVKENGLPFPTEDPFAILDDMSGGNRSQALGLLEALAKKGVFRFQIKNDSGFHLRIDPLSFGQAPDLPSPSSRMRLRENTFLRIEGGDFVLERPDGLARLATNSPDIGTLLTMTDVTAPHDEGTTAGLLAQASLCCGFFQGEADHALEKSHGSGLHRWEFHDLLFHMRSRIGYNNQPVGPDYRFIETEGPLPLYEPTNTGEIIELPSHAAELDSPFGLQDALSSRTSRRKFGDDPLSLGDLSKLLFLSCRIKSEMRSNGKSLLYDVSSRPSPSGGGCHSLEVYPVVNRCDGLESGLYRYRPDTHSLLRLESKPAQRQLMIHRAKYMNGGQMEPDVLLVISSRFGRVNWKYRSMSYATILKDAGALIQTLYLNCEQLQLAGTALGAGNIYQFAKMISCPIPQQSSVAEFVLGSRLDN